MSFSDKFQIHHLIHVPAKHKRKMCVYVLGLIMLCSSKCTLRNYVFVEKVLIRQSIVLFSLVNGPKQPLGLLVEWHCHFVEACQFGGNLS